MSQSNPLLLNLLTLPPLERKIVVYLARQGPADAATLAEALGRDSAEVQTVLTALVEQGHLYLSAEGQVDINLGQTRPRTLPARLWPALTASNRLYSAQEIATLRTAIPILQLARAKLSEFADHGPGHALRVKSFATQLGYLLGLTPTEHHLLRAGALFHDVGNIVERERHHLISQETVHKLTASAELPFSTREAELVGLLCRWHRRDYEPGRQDELGGEIVRTGLLASILRVADAMDIDQRRADYPDHLTHFIHFFYHEEARHWDSVKEILGVRIRCNPEVTLQVFTQGHVQDNIQVAMLRQDIGSTSLAWALQEIGIIDAPNRLVSRNTPSRTALLVFPFDPHSLVMAALSRKNLTSAGYVVELLCYPDTVEGVTWLWQETLPGRTLASYAHLVVINDRPALPANTFEQKIVAQWRAAGVAVTFLNRHEANWTRLPDLLQLGVEVTLGGDWVYFWGDPASQADLVWGRIAALCTRDPTQSTVGLTAEEQTLTRGLLNVVFDTIERSPDDIAAWSALAEPILARIEADNRAYFTGQAQDFVAHYATPPEPSRVDGQVLYFAQSPGGFPQAYYWLLEAAIEQYGRVWERGIHFKIPYAIATWLDGDAVEVLAINHWRDEAAIPIRLLYPAELGSLIEGNEGAIRVHLAADQAEGAIQALITACNRVDCQG